MKKIYFAPNWGLTSEQMVSDYINQTPNCDGVWNDIVVTNNAEEADYLIIQDNCGNNLLNMFDEDRRLYFSREALDSQSINNYPTDSVKRFSYWDGTGLLWTKWWYPNKSSGGINKTYNELLDETPINKTKNLSCIQSDKNNSWGHKLRHNFLGDFINKTNCLDLYGGIRYSNKGLENNNKCSGLDDYRYTLAFDNQNTIKDFFGTQFTDAILRWTVPIYWGGANLSKYFPEGSYIELDIENEGEIERITRLIEEDDYNNRLKAIDKARRLILNEYNMWPIIEKVIEK